MTQFVITQEESMHVRYLIEAATADEAREVFHDSDTLELGSMIVEGEIVEVAPLTEEVPKPHLKIIEASETLQGQLALTIEWGDGTETVEIVSQNAAAMLGYRYPEENQ